MCSEQKGMLGKKDIKVIFLHRNAAEISMRNAYISVLADTLIEFKVTIASTMVKNSDNVILDDIGASIIKRTEKNSEHYSRIFLL